MPPISFEPDVAEESPQSAPSIPKSFVADTLAATTTPKSFVADASQTPAPAAEDEGDELEHLPSSAYAGPTRYGRNANGRLALKWDGSQWVGLFDGKPAPAPSTQEMGPDPKTQVFGGETAPSVPSLASTLGDRQIGRASCRERV